MSSDDLTRAAVSRFWETRRSQQEALADGGKAGGGARAAAHMLGVRDLVASIFVEAGMPQENIRYEPFLPGYYRARKKWDMAVRCNGILVAALEFKSQVGSVGKNINNRFEEALGSATDVWAAHRNLAAYGSERPWLGYVFVLEESEETEKLDRSTHALFPVDPGHVGRSYNQKYQEMLTRFLNSGIYQAGWYITTRTDGDGNVSYREPLPVANGDSFRAAVKERIDYVRSLSNS